MAKFSRMSHSAPGKRTLPYLYWLSASERRREILDLHRSHWDDTISWEFLSQRKVSVSRWAKVQIFLSSWFFAATQCGAPGARRQGVVGWRLKKSHFLCLKKCLNTSLKDNFSSIFIWQHPYNSLQCTVHSVGQILGGKKKPINLLKEGWIETCEHFLSGQSSGLGGQVLNPLLETSEELLLAIAFNSHSRTLPSSEDILCSSFHYQIPP